MNIEELSVSDLQQEYKKSKNIVNSKEVLQSAMKIILNGGYGALGAEAFLYFLIDNAESITSTGQLVNQWTAKRVNTFLNKLVGNEIEKEYFIAGDTDSNYFEMDDIVKELGLQEESDDVITNALDEFVKNILEPEIQSYTNELCDYLNNIENKMVWEREVIAPAAIFVAKKRYAMLVKDSEGVRYEEPHLKIVGLESKKSIVPEWSRKLLEKCYTYCLNEDLETYNTFLNQIKNKVFTLRPDEIAIPSKINGIEKYQTSYYRYIKGTPKHVKAAINHNRLIHELGLTHYQPIKSGDSLKYVTLKMPNPIGEETIGFSSSSFPPEFKLDEYIDYNEAYERGFEKPLRNFVSAINWQTEEVVGLF